MQNEGPGVVQLSRKVMRASRSSASRDEARRGKRRRKRGDGSGVKFAAGAARVRAGAQNHSSSSYSYPEGRLRATRSQQTIASSPPSESPSSTRCSWSSCWVVAASEALKCRPDPSQTVTDLERQSVEQPARALEGLSSAQSCRPLRESRSSEPARKHCEQIHAAIRSLKRVEDYT